MLYFLLDDNRNIRISLLRLLLTWEYNLICLIRLEAKGNTPRMKIMDESLWDKLCGPPYFSVVKKITTEGLRGTEGLKIHADPGLHWECFRSGGDFIAMAKYFAGSFCDKRVGLTRLSD